MYKSSQSDFELFVLSMIKNDVVSSHVLLPVASFLISSTSDLLRSSYVEIFVNAETDSENSHSGSLLYSGASQLD